MPKPITRRVILKAGAASAVPLIFSSTAAVFGSPNETLRIGCIGVGRMGLGDMRNLLRCGISKEINARIVAVADPDGNRAAFAKNDIEQRYRKALKGGAIPDVATYSDFRELLARPDIDVVSISTPDFWHAGHGIAAAKAKKDIYIQKPMTLTIAEGKRLVKAVRENDVILQVGSQQRSDGRFRKACELVRNGRVGKLRKVEVWLPPDHGTAQPTDTARPKNFDYNMASYHYRTQPTTLEEF